MSKMKAVQLDDQERLLIIDQTRLPSELIFIELDDKGSLVDAIARLRRELRDAQDALDVLKKAINILGK